MEFAQTGLEQRVGYFRPPAMSGLSVATWNIHKGIGRDRRRDLNRTAAVIGEIAPDIMALQEADTRFFGRKGLLDLNALARDHGLIALALPGGGPTHGWYGNVLLLHEAEVDAVHRIDLPGLEPRGALITDLHHKGQPLRIIGTHLGLLSGSKNLSLSHRPPTFAHSRLFRQSPFKPFRRSGGQVPASPAYQSHCSTRPNRTCGWRTACSTREY